MCATDDLMAYRRDLYGRSERFRLASINATRRRRGKPEAMSLAEVQLRRAVS